MQRLVLSLNRVVERFVPEHTKDETLPFASYDQNDLENETSLEGGKTPGDNRHGSILYSDCAKIEKHRRDTVTGIEKPTISAWDAGWNVSNAIQVSILSLACPCVLENAKTAKYCGHYNYLFLFSF